MRAGPPVMVNSCTGKMGHATAEAVVRAGLELIPYTFCGTSQGVAVGSIGVSGVPVERVSAERRDQVRARQPMYHGHMAFKSGTKQSHPVTLSVVLAEPLGDASGNDRCPIVLERHDRRYPQLTLMDAPLCSHICRYLGTPHFPETFDENVVQ